MALEDGVPLGEVGLEDVVPLGEVGLEDVVPLGEVALRGIALIPRGDIARSAWGNVAENREGLLFRQASCSSYKPTPGVDSLTYKDPTVRAAFPNVAA